MIISQGDTLLFKNKFCKRGTVVLIENPDTTSIFLFVDNVTYEGVSGTVLSYGNNSIDLTPTENGVPVNQTVLFKHYKIKHIRFYYPYSQIELSVLFNKKMKIRSVDYIIGIKSITSVITKKNNFIVIKSEYSERTKYKTKYKTKEKDEIIDFIFKELVNFGVINDEYNFVGTKYNKSKKELDYLYSLKKN